MRLWLHFGYIFSRPTAFIVVAAVMMASVEFLNMARMSINIQ